MVPRGQRRAGALYRRLPSGNHGIGRAEIERNQRQRLHGALIAAVANHGYVDATVADVVDLAGVSRTTFYAHFKSKEECFLATHDLIVELGTERVSSAYRSAESPRDRLRAGFDAFVDVVTSDPAATQLVIIEALAAGREAVAHWERAAASFERMFRQSFDEARAAGPVSDITICAIVGGIRRVVYLHLRERRIDELPALVDDLLDWALSYQAPAVRPPARPRAPAAAEDLRAVSTAAAPPPDLAHARALYTQRERILRAVAALVAERGYAKLTIPHISATAGTSNQTLYENFSGKEEALLATFDDFAVRALAETGAAFDSMPTWPDALREALRTLLAFIASEPAFARLAFFELMTAGSAAQQRSELVLDAFAGFLQPGFERSPDVPPVVAHAIAGGIWSVVHNEIAHDRLAQLPALTPSVAYLALAPFLGASDAAEVARKRRRGGRRTRRSA